MTPVEVVSEQLQVGDQRLGLHVYAEPEPAGPNSGAAPMVLIWPAMGVPARFYRPLAENLHRAGLAVIAVDLRGTGSSTPPPSRRARYGYAELVDDVGAVLTALRPRLDGRRVLLFGHSLGGQLCALHLARAAAVEEPAGADGLVLVAVGLPWYRSYRRARRLGVLGYTQAIVAATGILGVWPGWGFGGRQARGVIRDWGFTARHGRFPQLRGVDVDTALARSRTAVLAISVENDQYTPASTVDHLCAKLDRGVVHRVHLTAASAGAPLDHFRWVKASVGVATMVAAFADGASKTTGR